MMIHAGKHLLTLSHELSLACLKCEIKTLQNKILRRQCGVRRIAATRNFASFNDFWKKPKHKEFGTYSIVKPGKVTGGRSIPSHINCPPYSGSMQPTVPPKDPEIQDESSIQKIRQSCQLARYVLDTTAKSLQVGMTTDEIDELVHNMTIENGAYPSPFNYMGFPKSVCTSVNNVACHGIPDDRPLHDGDIINVDVTVYLNGCHGDCSSTYLIGNVDDKGKALVEATRMCLNEAISICKDGEYFCNIGKDKGEAPQRKQKSKSHVIETVARRQGFTIIPAFAGHGIGTYFHGPPDIFHCHNDYPGRMKEGMIFTIEPVLSQGDREVVILEDGWTAVTLDNARTAQFEHTILVTKKGADILTGPGW